MEQQNEIIIYQSQDGTIKVDVLFSEETVWLTQTQIGSLFGKAKSTISEHIKNIFEEGELNENMVVRKFRTTTQHGAIEDKTQSHEVNYYNLDVIISVGYRVKSMQGTQFRIWATQRLRDYIIKGFTLNDERFKSGSSMNYFRELLDRIREIRLSERLFYQQIKDIYATSIDYDPSDEMTLAFYKEIQNKLLWAVSGKTAAELIYYRANAALPQMGLTSTSLPNKVRKADVEIGKNYLNEAKRSRRLFPSFDSRSMNKLTIPGSTKRVSNSVLPTNSRRTNLLGDISSRLIASSRLSRKSSFPTVFPFPKTAGRIQK